MMRIFVVQWRGQIKCSEFCEIILNCRKEHHIYVFCIVFVFFWIQGWIKDSSLGWGGGGVGVWAGLLASTYDVAKFSKKPAWSRDPRFTNGIPFLLQNNNKYSIRFAICSNYPFFVAIIIRLSLGQHLI